MGKSGSLHFIEEKVNPSTTSTVTFDSAEFFRGHAFLAHPILDVCCFTQGWASLQRRVKAGEMPGAP